MAISFSGLSMGNGPTDTKLSRCLIISDPEYILRLLYSLAFSFNSPVHKNDETNIEGFRTA